MKFKRRVGDVVKFKRRVDGFVVFPFAAAVVLLALSALGMLFVTLGESGAINMVIGSLFPVPVMLGLGIYAYSTQPVARRPETDNPFRNLQQGD